MSLISDVLRNNRTFALVGVSQNREKYGVDTVWMPPGSWSEQAVRTCEEQGIEEIHDVCLVFALRSVRGVSSEMEEI